MYMLYIHKTYTHTQNDCMFDHLALSIPHSPKAVCWTCVEAQNRQKAVVFDKALIYVHATEGDPLSVEENRPTHSSWSLRCSVPPGVLLAVTRVLPLYTGVVQLYLGSATISWGPVTLPGVLSLFLGVFSSLPGVV